MSSVTQYLHDTRPPPALVKKDKEKSKAGKSNTNFDNGRSKTARGYTDLGVRVGINAAQKWDPDQFWGRDQCGPVMLLVCSKFIRNRSYEGHSPTPAMCLSISISLTS